MKKFLAFLMILIVLFGVLGVFTVSGISDDSVEAEPDTQTADDSYIKELLKTAEDADYYAYMDLDSAEDYLKPVILEARDMVIKRIAGEVGGLAADGVYGEVVDIDGTVIEVVPQFHELFPADWDYPG